MPLSRYIVWDICTRIKIEIRIRFYIHWDAVVSRFIRRLTDLKEQGQIPEDLQPQSKWVSDRHRIDFIRFERDTFSDMAGWDETVNVCPNWLNILHSGSRVTLSLLQCRHWAIILLADVMIGNAISKVLRIDEWTESTCKWMEKMWDTTEDT